MDIERKIELENVNTAKQLGMISTEKAIKMRKKIYKKIFEDDIKEGEKNGR